MTRSNLIQRIEAVKDLTDSRVGVPGLIKDLMALQAAEPETDYSRVARKLASLHASIQRRPTPPREGATMEEQETMMPDWIVDKALDEAIALLQS